MSPVNFLNDSSLSIAMESVERVKRKKVLNDNDIRILNEHTEYRFFRRGVKRA